MMTNAGSCPEVCAVAMGGSSLRLAIVGLAAVVLAACSSTPVGPKSSARQVANAGEDASAQPPSPPRPDTAGRRGAYYLDDGPGERDPAELAALAGQPDPTPFPEPLHPRANQPYRVLGNDYRPMTRREPFRQRGVASWYGRKFHGQLTSIGERYDMYGLTAAHPTLPLPSFVRVTHLGNRRSVVLRVNDRGPFLHNRAIDLSYLAAYKLGYAEHGSAEVEVELLDPSRTVDTYAVSSQAGPQQAAAGQEASSIVAAGSSNLGPGGAPTPVPIAPPAGERVAVPTVAVPAVAFPTALQTRTQSSEPTGAQSGAQPGAAQKTSVPTVAAAPAVTSSTGVPPVPNPAIPSAGATSNAVATAPVPGGPATSAPIIISRVTSTPITPASRASDLAASSAPVAPPNAASPASSSAAAVISASPSPATPSPATASPATPSSATPLPAIPSPAMPSPPLPSPLATSPLVSVSPASSSAPQPADGAHFLQLGAFSVRTNAESASAELRRRLEWLRVPIAVQPRGGLFLVQAGPYPIRDLAARAGIEVKARTGLRPLLLQR